jgi:hypothetical protein
MARHVELGLNQFNQVEMGDIPEQTRERPDFGKIGTERVTRVKDALKRGFLGVISRVAAIPEMKRYYGGVASEKIGDVHEAAGNLKESLVDAIAEKIIIPVGEKTIEPAKAAVNATVEKGQEVYRGLETRAHSAYDRFQEVKTRTKEAIDRKMKDREFAAAKKNLDQAFQRYNAIAKATGRQELISRRMQL